MDHVARLIARVAGVAARRPVPVLVAVVVLAAAGGALAGSLTPSAATDTLLARGSDTSAATERYRQRFGDDAVVVLVREPVTRLVLTDDLARLVGLEGCLSGNLPRDVRPPGGPRGPCARLARARPAQVVYGPGTFLNESVRQIQEQFAGQQAQRGRQAEQAAQAARKIARERGRTPAEAARLGRQARQLVYAQFVRDSLQLAARYGIQELPRLDDPSFVSSVVFDGKRGYDQPKARFAYLFPSKDAALIGVRLKPGLSEAARRQAIADVRAATAMPNWKLRNGGTYTVTGAPVVLADLTGSLARSIVVLLVAALLVMAGTLAVVFRTRTRLLPLGLALAAAGLTFGGMALVGAPLTIASIAVLPILIGLAVDYAIQFQSRWDEERRPGEPPNETAVRTARAGAGTIATAGLATVAGFLVLLLSPIPMVRGFGLLLVAGIVAAFACAVTAGFAALSLAARRRDRAASTPVGASLRGAADLIGGLAGRLGAVRPVREARDLLGDGFRGGLALAQRHPRRIVGVALAAAALGWFADLTVTPVESDITRLVPQDTRSIQDLRALQRTTGVAGQVDVTVEGDDLTDPRVVRWMGTYQRRVLADAGYREGRGCGRADLCPALSLPDLFARTRAGQLSRRQVEGLLDTVPPYFSQAVITADRRTATMAFGIRLMPLERQEEVLDAMRAALDPPEGVRASVAGLPAQVAEANAEVSSPLRRLGFLVVGLLAVGAVLLAVYRRWQDAVVPLAPIVLATGCASLALAAINLVPFVDVPLNPMSVTLGALVLAISTEFSVLLAARYRAERGAGLAPATALERTYRRTGAAVGASAATALAGFAVLMVSDISMLRAFGFVTVLDLAVSLLAVMLVLPAMLVLDELRPAAGVAPRGAGGHAPKGSVLVALSPFRARRPASAARDPSAGRSGPEA